MEAETPDPEGEATISFLTVCDLDTPLGRGGHPQMLVLIDHARHVFARGRLVGHDVSRSTLNHLAFEIPSSAYDGYVGHLRTHGLTLAFSEFPALNARAMFFRDPEGNTLELICHHAAVAP